MEKGQQRKKSSLGIVKRIKQDDKSMQIAENKVHTPISTDDTLSSEGKNIALTEKALDDKDVEHFIENKEEQIPKDTSNATSKNTIDVNTKRRSFKKRKELDLLFDVDGPPSKRKSMQRKILPTSVKKTILGKRIILKSKRSIKNLEKNNEGTQERTIKSRVSPSACKKNIRRHSDCNKIKTRGKKNRYWYLFAKRDRKGNVSEMLSKPEDDDPHYYEWYRQKYLTQNRTKSTKTKRKQSYSKDKHRKFKNKEVCLSKEHRKVPKLVLKLPPGTLPIVHESNPKYQLNQCKTATFVQKDTPQENKRHAICKSCSVVLVDFSKCLQVSNPVVNEQNNSIKLSQSSIEGITYYKNDSIKQVSYENSSDKVDSNLSLTLARQYNWNMPDLLQHTVNSCIPNKKQDIINNGEGEIDSSDDILKEPYQKEFEGDKFHEYVHGQQISYLENNKGLKNSRILRCQFCSFVESEDDVIKRHIAETHKEKICYTCPLCNVSFFSNIESVEKHISNWHSQSELKITIKYGYYDVKGSSDMINQELIPKEYSVACTATKFGFSKVPKARKSMLKSKMHVSLSKNFESGNLLIKKSKEDGEKTSESEIRKIKLVTLENKVCEKMRVSTTEVSSKGKINAGISTIESQDFKGNGCVQFSPNTQGTRNTIQLSKRTFFPNKEKCGKRSETIENNAFVYAQASVNDENIIKQQDPAFKLSDKNIIEDCSSDEDDLAVEAFSVFNLKSPPLQILFEKPKCSDQSLQSLFSQSLVQYKQFQAKPTEVKSNLAQLEYVTADEKHKIANCFVLGQENSHFQSTGHSSAMCSTNKIMHVQKCARTLSCPYCTYKCIEMEVLHSHILTHEPNVKWTCPYCPMSNQMTKSVVEKHIKMCHPGSVVIYIPFGIQLQGNSW